MPSLLVPPRMPWAGNSSSTSRCVSTARTGRTRLPPGKERERDSINIFGLSICFKGRERLWQMIRGRGKLAEEMYKVKSGLVSYPHSLPTELDSQINTCDSL